MNCPSILDLTTADLTEQATLRRHVDSCLRCQALLRAWEAEPSIDDLELPEDPVELLDGMQSAWVPRSDPNAKAVLGAIYTVSAPRTDAHLLGLLLDMADEQATVYPISTEVHYAGDWDVLLEDEVLGFSAMVEAWNPIEILVEQMTEQITVIDPVMYLDLYDRGLAGDDVPGDVPDGPPLQSDEDPRHLFRETELERIRPYSEPARLTGFADSLADLLSTIRQERERDTEELAIAVGLEPDTICRLEAGKLNLQREISIPQFHSLIDELAVPPNERFFGFVEDELVRHDREEVVQRPVFARRRQTVRASRATPPEDERRKRAKAWVERLKAEMSKHR